MAKRQRGGARPGQRAPLQRTSQPAATPAAKPAGATACVSVMDVVPLALSSNMAPALSL